MDNIILTITNGGEPMSIVLEAGKSYNLMAEIEPVVTKARLYGKVTDASTGSGIPEAKVTLNKGTVATTALTDASGNYSIEVDPGAYDNVTVSKLGYTTKIITTL